MKRLAFYGRVSTEDQQDPDASRGWQLSRARQLVEPAGCNIVDEYFDLGTSRSLPWKRRPEAARLLADLSNPGRGFEGVVIGEPQRAFYGNQFSLTFPVFTHYGVQLWVPEVGGPIDPGSEAHDLVMTLFGGMSKGERSRIQVRTRTAMRDLAFRTGRFLGGRPPFGYRLVDAGPHPNPGRAAAGQRAHRLVPDEDAAPIVRQIFQMYLDGVGIRAIAQRLTDADVPSPSAHDPARNSHRDPRGWAFSAVRAILLNETYTGRRVWRNSGRSKNSSTLKMSLLEIGLDSVGVPKRSGCDLTNSPTTASSMTTRSQRCEGDWRLALAGKGRRVQAHMSMCSEGADLLLCLWPQNGRSVAAESQ